MTRSTSANNDPGGLSELTSAEVEILDLLAQGHTVKSVAAATGTTTGSVNERLRSARRKTGATSSRELARLVHNRKIVNTKIGVAERAQSAPPTLPGTATPEARGRRRGKAFAMIGVLVAVLAGTALWDRGEGISTNQSADPTGKSEFVFSSPSPLELHQRVGREPRDSDWSDKTETQLRAVYRSLPGPGGEQPITVRCATTICEVRGALPLKAELSQQWMEVLQGQSLHERVEKIGLKTESQAFGNATPGAPSEFVAYWSRR